MGCLIPPYLLIGSRKLTLYVITFVLGLDTWIVWMQDIFCLSMFSLQRSYSISQLITIGNSQNVHFKSTLLTIGHLLLFCVLLRQQWTLKWLCQRYPLRNGICLLVLLVTGKRIECQPWSCFFPFLNVSNHIFSFNRYRPVFKKKRKISTHVLTYPSTPSPNPWS